MSGSKEYICLVNFTAKLLNEISSKSRPLPLPYPAPNNLDGLLTSDEERQCNTPEGLKCGNKNVFESDGTPSEMVLRFEDNKLSINTNWRRMILMGVLEQNTFMSLWAYRDARGDMIFIFQEEEGPIMGIEEGELIAGPSEEADPNVDLEEGELTPGPSEEADRNEEIEEGELTPEHSKDA